MPDAIPVVADIPAALPGLGFADYVDAISSAIVGGQPAQFTIGIYGAWGSGKSSLLEGIASNLSANEDILVVRFDAWRHQKAADIAVPFLHEVVRRANERPLFKRAGRQLSVFLLALVSSLSFQTPVGISVSGKRFLDAARKPGMRRLNAAYERPFEELKKVPEQLGGRRIAVLVDDLDRCAPDKVVELLEALHLLTDIEGFVFVLALDYEVLVQAVAERYPHVSGHRFIEKMIQIPFRVPPLRITSPALMKELIPDWTWFVAAHSEAAVLAIARVSENALRANPRQIKRLLNNILLLERIVERRKLRVTTESLVAIVGLQLAWPDAFRDVQRATQSGSAEPVALVSSAGADPELLEYLETFKEHFAKPDQLSAALSLASTVDTGWRDPLGDTVYNGRAQAETQLRRVGFRIVDASAARSVWDHPRLGGIRVKTHPEVLTVDWNTAIGSPKEKYVSVANVRYAIGGLLLETISEWTESPEAFHSWLDKNL